jgi:hypothetical protein
LNLSLINACVLNRDTIQNHLLLRPMILRLTNMKIRLLAILMCLSASSVLAEDKPLSYGRDIRPILAENCFYCHGQDPNHRKADVRLDTAAGQKETLVAGKPEESELIKRIFSTEEGEIMPPPKANRKLTNAQKELLKRWVKEGAKFEGHWAYQAPKRPIVPKSATELNPIDAFLQAKQKLASIKPTTEADKITLLRRASLDLIGLPPTPEETSAFLKDTKPGAYERLIDRLMASPHYGERQALPWTSSPLNKLLAICSRIRPPPKKWQQVSIAITW